MNWKQEAIDKLRNYPLRQRAISTLSTQLEEVRLRCSGVRAAGGCAGKSSRENVLLDSLVCQEELAQRLAMTRQWVQAVDDALAALTDEERLVLDRFYIHPKQGHIEELCEALHLEQAGVYKRKDRALRRFTMALYGWEEV